MNSRLALSSFTAMAVHALLFIAPIKSLLVQQLNTDVIKTPSSIEISMVRREPLVQVDAKRVQKSEPEAVKASESIGAITEEIESLMINQPPAYPRLARIKGAQGEVILEADVTDEGKVAQVKVSQSSGYHILDMAAQKAVQKWRFTNVSCAAKIKIPVKFILQ